MSVSQRQRAIARVLVLVLVLNVAVALAKLMFGYATGAISIVSDGFHSLTDSASNIMGLVALRAARKPPDAEHPYGHRKYETLAAAGIFVFLLLVVIEVVETAISRLYGSGVPRVGAASFGVMLITLAVNLLVVRYESAQGRRLSSELLLADAAHTRSDVLTSCAVLISLAAVWLGFPQLDPIGALVIAVFIARTGYQIAAETSGILADRVVLEEDDIRNVVMSVPKVMGCHRIRTRGSRDHTFLDLHVWVSGETPLHEAHRLSHVVKDRLMHRYPHIADAIIHIEPPPSQIPAQR
ncbi:MAG TPA: cation diffusion facilitator family transporter [Vicinamibacterales bacterium]|nr:cation diffusion facilitator family transporter [Vicinamibacterales bacterium]